MQPRREWYPMAHDIVLLIAQYGLLLVFVNVLLEQAGVPVPAVPTLIVAGAMALEFLLLLLALYILAKWWQRRRLLAALRMARITVDELNQAIAQGQSPLVVDVRSEAARLLDSRVIPGALLADLNGIDRMVHAIPQDRELVIYCTCPNEVSAAKAAKLLMAIGYRRVRPLLGGLDAWDAAGYAVERLPSAPANDGLQAVLAKD